MELSYCSDSRGTSPFYPVMAGRTFQTLQMPTTWPTADEILGENGITAETINSHYLALLAPGLNVHTIHAEMEGGLLADVFADLLQRLLAAGVRFVTLGAAVEEFGRSAPACTIEMGSLRGWAGEIALQRG
jgi:undecaprenyl phosphate-alpha-L-ara4FN deformylase